MKVKVRLFGTLGQSIPGYKHSQLLEVEIPNGAMVKDLFAELEISESLGAVAIAKGKILNEDDVITEDVPLDILQAIRGGCNNQFYG